MTLLRPLFCIAVLTADRTEVAVLDNRDVVYESKEGGGVLTSHVRRQIHCVL